MTCDAATTVLTARADTEVVTRGHVGLKTIGDLLRDAANLSNALPDCQYALNLNTNRYSYLRALCAALMAGQCTLMPPNRQENTLADLQRLHPDSYRIDHNSRLEAGFDRRLQDGRRIEIELDRVVAIAFTSGSTGAPVPIRKHWHTLVEGAKHNFAAMIGAPLQNAHIVATVPSQHMWGFETSVMLPLITPVTISDHSPLYPLDIADALKEGPEPRVLVSSPLHLRTLMRSGVDIPRVERILTATSPLGAPEAREFQEHFDTDVLDVFGCSESGVIATRRTAHESAWRLIPPFSLRATESGTAIIGQHLPEEVMLPDAVEIIDDRMFNWLGRTHDMINIAGKRGSLADLNRRLLQVDGVIDGVILQPDEAQRLAALVVAPSLTSRDILAALKPQVDPAFLPRPVYMVDSLPRQETGKISRAAVMDVFDSVRRRRPNNRGDRGVA